MKDLENQLKELTELKSLYDLFTSGHHLTRVAHPALWAAFERGLEGYKAVFSALGYELVVDGRSYAWFEPTETSTPTGKKSKTLALLFMCIFNTQADHGESVDRFTHWRIDETFLATCYMAHQDILRDEGITQTDFIRLLDMTVKYGFARRQMGYWELLPSVSRYLDHFEALASHRDDEQQSAQEPVLMDEDGDSHLQQGFIYDIEDEEIA